MIFPAPKPKRRRKAAPKTKTSVKPVNAARRKREFARAYGSAARVRWVQTERCAVANAEMLCLGLYCENAHIKTGGRGRKADADQIVPLCAFHHDHLHRYGRMTFALIYDIDLDAAAAETERRWQEELKRREHQRRSA